MGLSAPTILQFRVQIPSKPSGYYKVKFGTMFVILLRKGTKMNIFKKTFHNLSATKCEKTFAFMI